MSMSMRTRTRTRTSQSVLEDVQQDSTFLQQAERSAKQSVCQWIRKTLQEVFLQSLQHKIVVAVVAEENNNNNNNHNNNHNHNNNPIDNHDIPKSSTARRIELSEEGLQEAFRVVLQVSEAWQDKLRAANHYLVAGWVNTVYWKKKQTLWAYDDDDDDDVHVGNDDLDDNETFPPKEPRGSDDETNGDDDDDDDDAADKAEEEPQNDDGPLRPNTTEGTGNDSATTTHHHDDHRDDHNISIPYCALRQLGARSYGAPFVSPTAALKQLKQMGRTGSTGSSQQHAYCPPLNETLIEAAVADIPNRMRLDKSSLMGNNTSNSSNNNNIESLSYQVIPKTLREKKKRDEAQKQKQRKQQRLLNDNDNDNDNDSRGEDTSVSSHENKKVGGVTTVGTQMQTQTSESSSLSSTITTAHNNNNNNNEVLSNLLARKKKNFARSSGASAKKPGRQRMRSTAEAEEESRLPLDIATFEDLLNSSGELLSVSQKRKLDQLLHSDHDRESSLQTLGLFGGLQKIGYIHGKLQGQQDRSGKNKEEEEEEGKGEVSDKKARRQQRAAIQERLNPHRVGKNSDPQRYRSRVLRTEDWYDESKKYFDLDLGWSLLEVGSGDEKRLCAFSSVEIALQDEDKNSDDSSQVSL